MEDNVFTDFEIPFANPVHETGFASPYLRFAGLVEVTRSQGVFHDVLSG